MNLRDRTYCYDELELIAMKYVITTMKYMQAGSNKMPDITPTIVEVLSAIDYETAKEDNNEQSK